MALPLLIDDAIAAIVQLEAMLANLRAAKKKAKDFGDFELPDGERIPMFEGMPPWAFSGPSPQSSDHGFGSSPTGLTDNAGIDNARKQAERDAGKARQRLLERKLRHPEEWKDFIASLNRNAQSSNLKVRFNARAMLAQLRRWGLI